MATLKEKRLIARMWADLRHTSDCTDHPCRTCEGVIRSMEDGKSHYADARALVDEFVGDEAQPDPIAQPSLRVFEKKLATIEKRLAAVEQTASSSDLVTVKDAAKVLGIEEKAMWSKVYRGFPGVVRPDANTVRIERSALDSRPGPVDPDVPCGAPAASGPCKRTKGLDTHGRCWQHRHESVIMARD